MKSIVKTVGTLVLMALLCTVPALGGSVVDMSANMGSASTMFGDSTVVQKDLSAINAKDDVISLHEQAAQSSSWCGTSDVTQISKQGVTGADNVALESINAANQYAGEGGNLVQASTQNTNNRGDASEFSLNTASQTGGWDADFTARQTVDQSGYGADENNLVGINDIWTVTGPCGSSDIFQSTTKRIDPRIVNAWDENRAYADTGDSNIIQKHDEVIGATESISSTTINDATALALFNSNIEQETKKTLFGPGDITSLSQNTAANNAFFGDATTDQYIGNNINGDPWGPAKPDQLITLGSYNQGFSATVFGEAYLGQETNNVVH